MKYQVFFDRFRPISNISGAKYEWKEKARDHFNHELSVDPNDVIASATQWHTTQPPTPNPKLIIIKQILEY
jgi:hypothetical protein